MLAKIKNRVAKLTKNKKGVSQLVEMLIILGIVVAAAAIVVPIILRQVNRAVSAVEPDKSVTYSGVGGA